MSNIERSGFFASLDGDRLYDDEQFASFFGRFLKDGFFPTEKNDGLLVQADGSNKITINEGVAWIQGRCYELLEKKQIQIEAGDALLSRIDRVVVRCDYVKRDIYIAIKKGQEASEPTAPELQRDSDAYELCIAQYKLEKGATNIKQSNITDTRKDIDLCGEVTSIIDKHSLKEFLKVTGFIMEGDIHTKNLIPVDDGCVIGTPEHPFEKITVQEIDILKGMPYLPTTGGTMTGPIYTEDLEPANNNMSNLGAIDKRYANAHITNLNVYGTHPFINKAGGSVTGAINHDYSPSTNQYQEMYKDFDNNGQGDGNTYIGYNLNGACTHIFRGKGDFNVTNPVANFQDVRAKYLMVNNKRVYIQPEAPVGAPEGSVWIKV